MTLTLHPLTGGSFINWLKLLQANQGIEPQYLLKGILISLASIAGIPNRILEKLIFDRQLLPILGLQKIDDREEDIDKVAKHWSFAIDQWQYSVPETLKLTQRIK